MERLLTIDEICSILQVSKPTVYRWVHYDYIPHIKLGSAVRFEEKTVLKWLKARGRDGRTSIGFDIFSRE